MEFLCLALILPSSIPMAPLGLLPRQHGSPAQDPPGLEVDDGAYEPEVFPSSDEAQDSRAGFSIPQGFHIELWAAEPLVANPVAFALDAAGRLFVAESFRIHAGVTDMREHMDWLHDELAAQTVEDRVAFMRKHEGEGFAAYSKEHERVRLLVDSDQDGRADVSTVFADGFRTPASGVAAGLLARGNELYYTCIPDLWRLRDEDGDGVAEEREALHSGYGVKIALLGHDLHGLRIGPDGRLYFSIGDRGLHVEHAGGTIAMPDRGAVLRCELDGSGLEVFASGLRNPQELVFDDHGNLFTGDNNSDSGDRARWVYVIRGGDSGWRHSYQYVTNPNPRGPWNAEGAWEPFHAEQPAYITPPVANFADGPAGLTYYPGVIWGPEWDGTFFLCDFRGASRGSGVFAFQNEAEGAGFRLVADRRFLWDSLVSDVDFGVDGAMWASDWVSGWGMTGKGRIWRLLPDDAPVEAISEVTALLGAGMRGREISELEVLAAHGHRQVRQEAYLELAERALPARGPAALALLRLAADRNGSRLARLSGIWGLGVLGRRAAWDARILMEALLNDPDPEIQAQAMRQVADAPYPQAARTLAQALNAEHPRVRAMAAEALGSAGGEQHVDALIQLLGRDAEQDPWIRGAAIHAIERLGTTEQILAALPQAPSHVRRSLVVVLRRWKDARVAQLLGDPSEAVVAEAARAIHDVPIPGARAALARLLEGEIPSDDYLLRRSLAAARELHRRSDRTFLTKLLARPALPLPATAEILAFLTEWSEPSPVDPVHGGWRPVPAGSLDELEQQLQALLDQPSVQAWDANVWGAWVQLVNVLELQPGSALAASCATVARDESMPGALRASAFDAYFAVNRRDDSDLLDVGLAASDFALRAAAYGRLAQTDPQRAVALLDAAAREEDATIRQIAVRGLDRLDAALRTPVLMDLARAAQAQSAPSPIAVELVEGLRALNDESASRVADAVAANVPRATLEGGRPLPGRRIFRRNAEAQCLRCHVADSAGASEDGPALDGVGDRLEREGILQSMLEPNAVLAEGYENWIFALVDGTQVVGRVVEEGPLQIVVMDAEGVEILLEPDEIEARRQDLSAMPLGLVESLSLRELRDLVAYLASLKDS